MEIWDSFSYRCTKIFFEIYRCSCIQSMRLSMKDKLKKKILFQIWTGEPCTSISVSIKTWGGDFHLWVFKLCWLLVLQACMLLAMTVSNFPEKILASMHWIRSTYHFPFGHYIPYSCSGDGTKKKYLEFCYVSFITKFFRTRAQSNWLQILSRAMIQIIHNTQERKGSEYRWKEVKKRKNYYCYYCYMSTQEVPLSWTSALYNRGQPWSTLEIRVQIKTEGNGLQGQT